MNKDYKVSIIVPIYNVEKYVAKCIDSLIGQTYSNIEIILVNDGSTDGSRGICEKYAHNDNRIKLINKNNGGLSDARNKGLDIATGEYVFLVDSDDYIDLNTISLLIKKAGEYQADVVVCNYIHVLEKQGDLFSFETSADTVEVYDTGIDFYRQICDGKNRIGHCNLAWGKLYKTSLFKKIRYPFGKIHEDEWTTYKVLAEAKRTVYIDDILYYYLIRDGSIMRTKKPERDLHRIEAYEERYKFFEERNEDKIVYHTLSMLLGGYIIDYYKISNPDIRKMLYKKCKKLYRKERKRFGLVKRCQYCLFLTSPQIYKKLRSIDE